MLGQVNAKRIYLVAISKYRNENCENFPKLKKRIVEI